MSMRRAIKAMRLRLARERYAVASWVFDRAYAATRLAARRLSAAREEAYRCGYNPTGPGS